MAKRERGAATAAAIASAFIEAAKGLPPVPDHVSLRPGDMPYWESIVGTKPRAEWTEVQLVAAAQLARAQADIAQWSEDLDNSSAVIYVEPHNNPRPNPLISMIEQATRRQLAIMRSLGLANKEDIRDAARRQDTLRKARQVREGLATDPLLAS